jgi:8-amino-7-oxononanoate synthase
LIYTTFMSYPSLMAIRTAYDWLQSGRAEVLASNLQRLIRHLYQRLCNLEESISSLPDKSMLVTPAECPRSAIFALLSTKPRELAAHCQKAGFIVRAVVHPTVPQGTERVRVCLHAGNTTEEIDSFVQCVEGWIKDESTGIAAVINNKNWAASNALDPLPRGSARIEAGLMSKL